MALKSKLVSENAVILVYPVSKLLAPVFTLVVARGLFSSVRLSSHFLEEFCQSFWLALFLSLFLLFFLPTQHHFFNAVKTRNTSVGVPVV